jgi:NAD(P)-dependent dehydrogenase (short-subunit alcohol dehydrogenase family)
MKLENKIIIVTGGNGLLGKSIISYLISKGASVINVDVAEMSDVASTFYIKCDITDAECVRKMVTIIVEKFKRIDGLVNNAYPRTKDWGDIFENVSLDSWKQNVDMQLNSCFHLSQLVLAVMKYNKSGSIVNIASIYGIVGNDFSVYEDVKGMTSPVAYSAIKGGIINLTRYLASYFGPYSIRINCVSPGGVFNNQAESFVNKFERKVPLRRMATPTEIAPSVAFLLSDESTYITGHNLVVDGGWTAI